MTEQNPDALPPGALDYGEQDENGIDLSLIRSNLKLTPSQGRRERETILFRESSRPRVFWNARVRGPKRVATSASCVSRVSFSRLLKKPIARARRIASSRLVTSTCVSRDLLGAEMCCLKNGRLNWDV